MYGDDKQNARRNKIKEFILFLAIISIILVNIIAPIIMGFQSALKWHQVNETRNAINSQLSLQEAILMVQGNKRIALVISQIIFTVFLVVDLYLILNKDAIAAKLLAAGSFVIFMFLLIISLKPTLKSKSK